MLRRSALETDAALHSLAGATVAGHPLLAEVKGSPVGRPVAYCPSHGAVEALDAADEAAGQRIEGKDRVQVAAAWARHRGRVSTTEIDSILHMAPSNVGRALQALERDGVLLPGRENRLGAGFFYIPT